MKKFYLFLVLLSAFYCLAAGAQTYQVTEEQLQKLETIYQNYKSNNQKLQSQIYELQKTAETLQNKAQNLQKESETLSEQLTNERNSTASLSKSLKTYEINEAKRQDQILNLTQDLAERDHKINKLKIACVSLTATTIILLLTIAAGIYVKIKYHK